MKLPLSLVPGRGGEERLVVQQRRAARWGSGTSAADRRLAGRVAAVCLVVLSVLCLGAPGALAATPGQSYGYTNDIGTPDAGALIGTFVNSVAVSNDDGNVFIARQGDRSQDGAIDVLDPSGARSPRSTRASDALAAP